MTLSNSEKTTSKILLFPGTVGNSYDNAKIVLVTHYFLSIFRFIVRSFYAKWRSLNWFFKNPCKNEVSRIYLSVFLKKHISLVELFLHDSSRILTIHDICQKLNGSLLIVINIH